MNVMNENGETSSSRNVGGDMNVVDASDDASFFPNVSGGLEVINESDELSTENLSADFFGDVRTLQKPKPHWLFYPRVLNSLVQNTGKFNFLTRLLLLLLYFKKIRCISVI